MKTKNIFKTLAFAMLMPTMLLTTACSSEDDLVNNTAGESTASTKGYPFPVTVNVSRQGDGTRATYTYDEGTKKGTLAFSKGDKLFVYGSDPDAGSFAGTLDYDAVSGKFSGTIYTQNEYHGTITGLMASDATAFLLPAGYESYGFNSIEGNGYNAMISFDFTKAFALTKKEAVEQFSFESVEEYNNGFALAPVNAIVSFTISGLTANKEVAVSFDTDITGVIDGNVTTSAEGVATFAVGVYQGQDLGNFTLTVDGNNIAMPTKTTEAGHIYNISRNAVLSAATAEDIGKVIGADGRIYANVAAAKAASTTACAIIAYVGSETGEASPYNHGLAIAMKDASAGYLQWKTSSGSNDNTNQYAGAASAIAAKESGSALSDGRNNSTWPAFEAALANSIDVTDGISAAAPASGTSGWFLPSLYQWNMIVKGLSGKTADLSESSNGDYKASSLNTKITAAGGEGLQEEGGYLSSTEYDGSRAWGFDAYSGGVGNASKELVRSVRSVFAF